MPKMKTRKSAAKRFELTGSGKIVHEKSGMSHLLEHESSNAKRGRQGKEVLHKTHETKVKRMLGI